MKKLYLVILVVIYLNILTAKSLPTCPSGCQCMGAQQCKWSDEIIQILSDLTPNDLLWKHYSSKFVKQICDRKKQHVCCCGSKQESPDKCKCH